MGGVGLSWAWAQSLITPHFPLIHLPQEPDHPASLGTPGAEWTEAGAGDGGVLWTAQLGWEQVTG